MLVWNSELSDSALGLCDMRKSTPDRSSNIRKRAAHFLSYSVEGWRGQKSEKTTGGAACGPRGTGLWARSRSYFAAPVDFKGMSFEVNRDRDDRVAELSRLKRNEPAARRASETKPLAVTHQEDLAVEEPVVVILAWRDHITMFTHTVGFDANTPTGLKYKHAAGGRDLIVRGWRRGWGERTEGWFMGELPRRCRSRL